MALDPKTNYDFNIVSEVNGQESVTAPFQILSVRTLDLAAGAADITVTNVSGPFPHLVAGFFGSVATRAYQDDDLDGRVDFVADTLFDETEYPFESITRLTQYPEHTWSVSTQGAQYSRSDGISDVVVRMDWMSGGDVQNIALHLDLDLNTGAAQVLKVVGGAPSGSSLGGDPTPPLMLTGTEFSVEQVDYDGSNLLAGVVAGTIEFQESIPIDQTGGACTTSCPPQQRCENFVCVPMEGHSPRR